MSVPADGRPPVPYVCPRDSRPRRALRMLVLSAAGLLAACGTQTPLLSLIFDIPASGKDPGAVPVVRQPRRSVPTEREQLVVTKEYLANLAAAAKAGPPPNWPDIFKKLPKDDEDNIDWNQALRDKVISPRAAIERDAPEPPPEKVFDQDVKLATSGKPNRMVVFSHKAHAQWLTCSNCHPAIFAEKTGTAKITMDDIDEGKFCGVCHDKVAMAMPSGCKGCHKISAPEKPKKKA
ncbi:MAG: hypothetical protein Fur0039_21400 [Rhodocyclaceae bacterium]